MSERSVSDNNGMSDPHEPVQRFARENPDLVRDDDVDDYFYHIHISLNHKFMYFETPKAACSTIKVVLQRLELRDPSFFLPRPLVHERYYSPLLSPAQIGSFR